MLYLVHNVDYHIRMLKKCTVVNITLSGVCYVPMVHAVKTKSTLVAAEINRYTRAVVYHYVHHCVDL